MVLCEPHLGRYLVIRNISGALQCYFYCFFFFGEGSLQNYPWETSMSCWPNSNEKCQQWGRAHNVAIRHSRNNARSRSSTREMVHSSLNIISFLIRILSLGWRDSHLLHIPTISLECSSKSFFYHGCVVYNCHLKWYSIFNFSWFICIWNFVLILN